MKVYAYTVLDPLALLEGYVGNLPSTTVYARIGEHGLLEDYLYIKGFVYLEPQEIEVSDDFDNFGIYLQESPFVKLCQPSNN